AQDAEKHSPDSFPLAPHAPMTHTTEQQQSAPRSAHPQLLPATRANPSPTGTTWSSFDSKMKHGRGNPDTSAQAAHTTALAMLEAFLSAGARHFDVTWTNAAGGKERFRRNVAAAELRHTLPGILDEAIRRQRNLIVRPHGPGVS